MAARLTRAKKKIAAARIPYRVPPPEELAVRTGAVLTVVHLLFTTGHTAPTGGSTGTRRSGRARSRRRADAARPAAGRRRRGRPAGAPAPDRQPARHPDGSGRQPRAAGRPGPQPLGSSCHRRRMRAREGSAARAANRAFPVGSRHCRCARRSAGLGADRLAADRRPVRRAARPLALARRRAEPRRRRQLRGRARGRASPSSTGSVLSISWRATPTCRPPAPMPCAGSGATSRPAMPTRRP